MKHIAKYGDIKDFVAETVLFSAASKNENKRLLLITKVSNRAVFFKVINYVTGYEKEFNSLENAINDYNGH